MARDLPFFNLASVKDAFVTERKPFEFIKIGRFFYKVISDETIPRCKDLIARLQAVGGDQGRRYFESNIGQGFVAGFDNKYLKIKLSPIE